MVGLVVNFAALTWLHAAGEARGREAMLANEPAPEEPLRLGASEGRVVTLNWLGFPEPTPHEAPRSEVAQSALSPDARSRRIPTAAETIEAIESRIARAIQRAESELAPALRGFLAAIEEAAAAAARERVAEAAEAAPVRTAGAPPEAGGETNALQSESESVATALEDPIVVQPGAVAVGEGIELRTRRARWTTLTRATAMPRNPLVEIQFGADGKVVRASFVPGHSSGYPDVDGPLLDAVYLWTASGERIEALKRSGRGATLTIKVRVLLR